MIVLLLIFVHLVYYKHFDVLDLDNRMQLLFEQGLLIRDYDGRSTFSSGFNWISYDDNYLLEWQDNEL